MQSGSEQKMPQIRTIPDHDQNSGRLPSLEASIASLPLGEGLLVEKRFNNYVLLAIALYLQTKRRLLLRLDLSISQLDILLKNMREPGIFLAPCPSSSINKRDYPQCLANLKYLVTTMRQDAILYLYHLTSDQLKFCMENLKPGARVFLRCVPHSHPERDVFLAKTKYIVSHMPQNGVFDFELDTSLLDIKEILPLTPKGAIYICKRDHATRETVELMPKGAKLMLARITVDVAVSLIKFIPEGVGLYVNNWSLADAAKLTVAWNAKRAAMEIPKPLVEVPKQVEILPQPEMKITKEKRKAKVLDESTKTQKKKKEVESETYKKPKAFSGNIERLRKIRDPLIEAIAAGELKEAEQYYSEFMDKANSQKSPLLTLRSLLNYQPEDQGYKFIIILAIEKGYLKLAQKMVDDLIECNNAETVTLHEKIVACISRGAAETRKKAFVITPETKNKLDNLFAKVLGTEVLSSSSMSSSSPATDYSQMSSPRSTASTSISSSISYSSIPTALQEHSLFGSSALSLATDYEDQLRLDDPFSPGIQSPNQFSTSQNLPPLQTPVGSYSIDDGMMDFRDGNDEPSLLDDPFDKFGLSGGFSS